MRDNWIWAETCFFEALDVTGIPVLCGKSHISTSEKGRDSTDNLIPLKELFHWSWELKSLFSHRNGERSKPLTSTRPRTFGTWEVKNHPAMGQHHFCMEDQWTHKGPILWEKVSEANRNRWIRSTPCSHLPATTNAKLLRRVAKLLEITIYRFPLVYSGTSWICLPVGETT